MGSKGRGKGGWYHWTSINKNEMSLEPNTVFSGVALNMASSDTKIMWGKNGVGMRFNLGSCLKLLELPKCSVYS